MCCFVILLLSNEMQISVRRFSAILHLRAEQASSFPSGDSLTLFRQELYFPDVEVGNH